MAVASKTWTASYGRYVRLRITAQEVEVDVPNNRSKVRVTGQIYYPGGTRASNGYPQTYTVTVDGTQIGRQTGITYNLASGGTRSLTTYTSGWINHNSNGAKTVTVRGHITDGAGDTGTISQSYALTTIARASTLSSFSMPNHLKPGTTTSFSLGITRRSTSFTHDIQLRDGNTVIASWSGQGTPTALGLTAVQTNYLLNRMSSSTSRTLTLRVQTKSGSTNIGGALTRTATVYVHSSVKPTVSELSVAIQGNTHARDVVKRFVQNVSRVSGNFKITAKGGASIRSSKLEIRRKSGGADYQYINTNSGWFPRVLALNDQYQARGTATDSRGRSSDTGWVDLSNFNVLAYSTPQITRFSADRRTSVPTTVDVVRNGTHSGLSGSNVLTITLQKRASGTTSWTNVAPNVTTSSSPFGATIPSTGHSVASSYEFRLYIVDQIGHSAEQISTVSTQRAVLDIHKNEGVGIGKIREKGVLDVDGEAYFRGRIEIDGADPNTIKINTHTDHDDSYISWYNNLDVRKGWVGFGSTGTNDITLFNDTGDDVVLRANNGGKVRVWNDEIIGSGTNSNGSWTKLYNGTLICYRGGATYTALPNTPHQWIWEFPMSFTNTPTVLTTAQFLTSARIIGAQVESITTTSASGRIYHDYNQSLGLVLNSIVIGRWKL